jgi:hypothetical protein
VDRLFKALPRYRERDIRPLLQQAGDESAAALWRTTRTIIATKLPAAYDTTTGLLLRNLAAHRARLIEFVHEVRAAGPINLPLFEGWLRLLSERQVGCVEPKPKELR